MRKVVVGILILAGFYVVDGLIGRKLPTSFPPRRGLRLLFHECPASGGSVTRQDGSGVAQDRGDAQQD